MPVVEPIDATWHKFRAALTDAWGQVTGAANWMMTELYARDTRRGWQSEDAAHAARLFVSGCAAAFPSLAPLTVASLEHMAQGSYRAVRYHVVWTRARSLPTYRYPVPLPIHNQLWRATMVHERPVVRVRIGGRWWALRLKGGPRYQRRLAAYAQILTGEAIAGELALYRRRAHEGPLLSRPHGDQQVAYGIACKIVAWLPRIVRAGADPAASVLRVQTATDALIVAFDRDEEVWRYHGDHLRRWSAEHRKATQHFSDDRPGRRGQTPRFVDRCAALALRYRHRMNSAVQETAAHVIGYAQRLRYACVQFDDSVRAILSGFSVRRISRALAHPV